jgi:hypothetical protein
MRDMRSRPTIRLYSHDAKRQRGSSKLGVVVGLGLPALFGAGVYAATDRGAMGPWLALALLLFVVPVAVVALSRARFGLWVR